MRTVPPEGPDEHPVPAHIATPAQLRDFDPPELLEAWQGHISVLVAAEVGTRDYSPGYVGRAALDALVTGAALVAHIDAARWPTCVDALSNGVPLAHVAAAMGLDVDEIVYGLRSWADRQFDHGEMSRDQHCAVIALVPDPSTRPRI